MLISLTDVEAEVRACAAYALGQLHAQPESAVPRLIDSLKDHDITDTVAWALAKFGPRAAVALPQLLGVLKDALGRCDAAADYLIYAVRAISPAPEDEIRRVIASCDVELRQQLKEGFLPEADSEIPLPPGGRPWITWPGRIV